MKVINRFYKKAIVFFWRIEKEFRSRSLQFYSLNDVSDVCYLSYFLYSAYNFHFRTTNSLCWMSSLMITDLVHAHGRAFRGSVSNWCDEAGQYRNGNWSRLFTRCDKGLVNTGYTLLAISGLCIICAITVQWPPKLGKE